MPRTRLILLPLLPMLGACWTLPDEVLLTGRVLEEQDGGGFEGASLQVHDPLGEAWSQGTTGADGDFELVVPASSAFFLTLSADGYVSTSFTGIAGASDVVAEDGTLFLREQADVDALRAEFSACPRVDEPGPIIEGEVRPYFAVDAEPEELPTIATAWVTVYEQDDTATSACYLDDDGNSLPDGTRTGATGRFAIFGAPEGPVSLEVSYDLTSDYALSTWYIVRPPTDGIVPMYPAWVDVP